MHLLIQGICCNQDIGQCVSVNVFHVSVGSVRRWQKILSEEGEFDFFTDNRYGHSYKLTKTFLFRIQSELDLGHNNYSIAKAEGISKGSIPCVLSKGSLRKHPLPPLTLLSVATPTASAVVKTLIFFRLRGCC